MPKDTLRSQIDCVLADIGADVVKTGMLPTAEVKRWLHLILNLESCHIRHMLP